MLRQRSFSRILTALGKVDRTLVLYPMLFDNDAIICSQIDGCSLHLMG